MTEENNRTIAGLESTTSTERPETRMMFNMKKDMVKPNVHKRHKEEDFVFFTKCNTSKCNQKD